MAAEIPFRPRRARQPGSSFNEAAANGRGNYKMEILSPVGNLIASMRPRRMAAEIHGRRVDRGLGSCASMRPRRMAAEIPLFQRYYPWARVLQ